MTALDVALGAGSLGARWTPVCVEDRLVVDRGVCALVDGEHVAVFATSFGEGLYAIGNVDPFTGASVLSRGLVGLTVVADEAVPYVASPLRKHRVDLRDGRALDDPTRCCGTWQVRRRDGWLEVGARLS